MLVCGYIVYIYFFVVVEMRWLCLSKRLLLKRMSWGYPTPTKNTQTFSSFLSTVRVLNFMNLRFPVGIKAWGVFFTERWTTCEKVQGGSHVGYHGWSGSEVARTTDGGEILRSTVYEIVSSPYTRKTK